MAILNKAQATTFEQKSYCPYLWVN